MRFLIFPLLCLTAAFAQDSDNEGIHWFDNYKDAIREAKRTQKPIFLEYRCEA
jgi:uncharacterized protein YyaL (SSP411 family)